MIDFLSASFCILVGDRCSVLTLTVKRVGANIATLTAAVIGQEIFLLACMLPADFKNEFEMLLKRNNFYIDYVLTVADFLAAVKIQLNDTVPTESSC